MPLGEKNVEGTKLEEAPFVLFSPLCEAHHVGLRKLLRHIDTRVAVGLCLVWNLEPEDVMEPVKLTR